VAQAEGEYIDVVDMKLTNIVDLIKGPKDTLVRLQIRPIKDPSTKKEVRIIRDKIKLTENLAKGYIKQIIINGKTTNVGVVELPSFYGSSGKGPKATDDVDELITKLKSYDIKGLILDLRRNGGGYLSEAVNLTGLFISRGPVVQVKYSDGKIRKKFDFNPKISWNGPLLTLVSRYSASASEIVAGALQDHDRAIIVGDESTHGKGTVQSMVQMNLPFNLLANRTGGKTSAAKITIQKYYLPSGKSTQINGVKSDISMPSINSLLPIGESDLENALPNDKIAAVNFRKTNEQFSFNDNITSQLNDKAAERRAESKSFEYLNENISFFKSKREQNEFSLNLNDRLKERIKEKRKSEQLKEKKDSFKQISYPSKKIQLSIVDEQILQSRKARGLDQNRTESSEEFEIPESFDLRLHESLNILTDYLEYSNASASTSRSIQNPQEI
jgi:carboxyl-terminal processing protease